MADAAKPAAPAADPKAAAPADAPKPDAAAPADDKPPVHPKGLGVFRVNGKWVDANGEVLS